MNSLVAALVATFGLSSLGCSTISSWTGSNLEKKRFQIESLWVRPTIEKDFLGFRRLNRMSTILGADLVFQANAVDGLVAYDRKYGNVRWRLPIQHGIEGGAVLVDGKLYFGGGEGVFYCVQSSTGKIEWTYQVRAETLSAPSVEGGVVYFQSGVDIAYALDASTGRLIWTYNRQTSNNLSIRASTSPVVLGEKVFVGFSDGVLVALKKKDGSVMWERRLGKGNRFKDVDSTPVIDGERMYVSSYDGSLFALNTSDGEVLWQVDEGGYVPVALGRDHFSDRLFYSTIGTIQSGGKVLAIDRKSGKILGQYQLKNGIATQPVTTKSYLIFGESEGALVVLDPTTMNTLGKFEPGRGLFSKPAVSESSNEVYFISNNANLFRLSIGFKKISDRLPWEVEPPHRAIRTDDVASAEKGVRTNGVRR